MPPSVVPASASAPAKTILLGEHAVLYGHPAVALPFPPLQAQATLEPAEETTLVSERYPDLAARLTGEVPRPLVPLAEAVKGSLEAIARTGTPIQSFRLSVTSEIPAGAGLGSSAAVVVAAIRATFSFHGSTVSSSLLRHLATQAEAVAHGASSGLDPSTVASEGPIRFVRDHAPVPLAIREPFGLVVADTGEHVATRDMVERVKARVAAYPQDEATLAHLGELAEELAERLEQADYNRVGELLNLAHADLSTLGLSTPKLDAVSAAARLEGAYGAKLSGGGGGGCVVAMVPLDRLKSVADAMARSGASRVWPAQYLIQREGTP